MHKITKGLKKKKKGKKSKHKEDDLFKPEELEAYRREHQQQQQTSEGSSGSAPPQPTQNEEWKKFLALTSEVDDILKKTQGDLDRIKSTSFFQRVPTPSQQKQQQQQQQKEEVEEKQNESVEPIQETVEPTNLGIVEVSESESEEEEDEDIFDTAYIDAIAAGEVKLAYIPESPTEEDATGDDPFDTSIAERAILGPAVERKGKKLVPIGAAVEVLTGRVQLPTCATQRPPVSNRRQVLKEKDLLLGSFDDNANAVVVATTSPVEVRKTLLDEDTPLPDEPIDLTKSLHQVATPVTQPPTESHLDDYSKDIVSEFDVIIKNAEDEDDEEFAALAAESLAKTPTVVTSIPLTTTIVNEDSWAAFDNVNKENPEDLGEVEDDPFDTAFAANILPGKAELKIIENEILNEDIDFDPRAEDKLTQIINKVSINVTDPTGQRESLSPTDRVSEAELNLIKPIHRDLLGGSNTDLSNLNDQPLKPSEQIDDNYIEYCDPFDTSIVETAQLPGQTELKFIEKELLGDLNLNNNVTALSDHNDDDFDPRGDEIPIKERARSRPDALNIGSVKTVSFDLPSPTSDLLAPSEEPSNKKPLTPFYIRKSSIPEEIDNNDTDTDPFDTSFAANIAPGRTELKYIEQELFDPISDHNFDPRDENQAKIDRVVESIKQIAKKPSDLPVETTKQQQIDLLSIGELEIGDKVLTPAAESCRNLDDLSYKDPFDTSSINTNILPGKTELKLLESELIHSSDPLVDADFDPRAFSSEPRVDLFDNSGDIVIQKPLNPVVDSANNSFDCGDIDPFDTSIANNIGPGKTELKLLESELV